MDVWSTRMSPVRKVPSDLAAIWRIAGAQVLVMYLVQIARHLPDILRSRTLRLLTKECAARSTPFGCWGRRYA